MCFLFSVFSHASFITTHSLRVLCYFDRLNIVDEKRAGKDFCCFVSQAVRHREKGTPVRKSQINDSNLVSLDFETKPLSSSSDMRLDLSVLPIEVVYVPETIEMLSDFFAPPEQLKAVDEIASAASASLSALQTSTATGLMYAIGKRTCDDSFLLLSLSHSSSLFAYLSFSLLRFCFLFFCISSCSVTSSSNVMNPMLTSLTQTHIKQLT